MRRDASDRRRWLQPAALALAIGLTPLLAGAGPESGPSGPGADDIPRAGAADDQPDSTGEWLSRQAVAMGRRFEAWYRGVKPADRITWGGLGAAAFLGVLTLLERVVRVRRRRVIPNAFRERFHARLLEGKLDWGKGLDYCELNPSPAARVALAAIRRWGRPAPDLDRAVALAKQAETDRLRRHVGTLRRIAALAPLIGLLGTLHAASQALASLTPGAAWGPAMASALAPLTAGVALAILALVAYDGLMGRVENLAGDLDRLGAEIVDAIALAGAPAPAARSERAPASAQIRAEPASRPRAPHPVRVEIPERVVGRPVDFDDEDL